MSTENPKNIIRSWNLQQNFASGPIVQDSLTPPVYGRIRTPFVGTWREQQLENALDWDAQNFSVYLPESLMVLQSLFLKIKLPANSGATAFKRHPGIHAVKSYRIMSAGQEVYVCNVKQHLIDYMQSLSQEQLTAFSTCYLGDKDPQDSVARTILVPVLLPNSTYIGRSGGQRGHGVFPCYTGSNRVEIQITMNVAKTLSSDPGQAPTSIAGECSFLYHQAEMDSKNLMRYSDLRGAYSIINRRFTELTSGFKSAGANTETQWTISQPQGCVVEVMLLAFATDSDETKFGTAYLQPKFFRIEADNVIQKNLDSAEKILIENYTNGFVSPNTDFAQPARLCFASHAAFSDHKWCGGYNMSLASNIRFVFEFGVAVKYKLVSISLQRVKIDAQGVLRAYLD